MTNKEEYRHICEKQGSAIPIYAQHWWMEAVCQGKHWDVAIAHDQNGTVKATLPYLIGTKLGFRYILMPQLTQTNGIHYFYEGNPSPKKKLEFEKKWAKAIISQLDELKLSLYIQNFHPSITNWLPFYWSNYKQTTRYTYRINAIADTEQVFANFSSAKQRQIRKAQRNGLRVDMNKISPEQFYEFHNQVIAEKSEKDEIDEHTFLTLAKAALARKQGALFSIGNNALQAALFMVWDDECAYYLVPANSREYSTTGASTLLVWEAIKAASKTSRAFDFEGSMAHGIENSYSQFGTTQTPYNQIAKANNLITKLWLFRHF